VSCSERRRRDRKAKVEVRDSAESLLPPTLVDGDKSIEETAGSAACASSGELSSRQKSVAASTTVAVYDGGLGDASRIVSGGIDGGRDVSDIGDFRDGQFFQLTSTPIQLHSINSIMRSAIIVSIINFQ
jgi:hypothetical protein